MALSDLKDAVLTASKQVEICTTLHKALLATTEEEFIEAGMPLALWTYQTGIVTDALLADFTEAKLNAFGVYTTGTFNLTDPATEIFVLKTANVTVNLTGNTKIKINACGNSVLAINADDNVYADVKLYDASATTLTQNNDSLINLETKSSGTLTTIINNTSVNHMYARGNAIVNLTANDASYALANMYLNSALTYILTGTAQMNVTVYNNATAINSAP